MKMHNHYLSIVLLGSALLFGGSKCSQHEEYREYIYNRWVHSYEEDTQQERWFRPAGSDLPEAESGEREELYLKKNGSIVFHQISHENEIVKKTGLWTAEDSTHIRVVTEEGDAFVLKIDAYNEDIMIISNEK
ncbi:MAG: hypothetical protein WD077_01205 [Bacteroidia bacterium]